MATRQKTGDRDRTPAERVLTAFEQYRERLQRFLRNRSPRTDVASDLAQEVYLRLLRFPPQELIRRPQAYLYRIASNVLHDFNLRTIDDCVTFDSSTVDELAESTANSWVDDPADQLSSEQELAALLADLPVAHRAALVLAKRDGLSYEAIAEKLGVTEHAVKKYVVRAMAHCRAMTKGRKT